MKCLLLLAIALAPCIAAGEEWKPNMDEETNMQSFKACTEQSGLTKEKLQTYIKANHLDETEVREYVLCHVKKLGLFTDGSGYNADRVIALFTALGNGTEEDANTIRECVRKSDPSSTPAVRAFQGVVCICGDDFDKIYKKVRMNANNTSVA